MTENKKLKNINTNECLHYDLDNLTELIISLVKT